ncbi:transposase [Devosia sp. YIM 151766]|uniref:transposase n=1 Tax=Devosia sp. YIM 151766 TaxID=3017325 RepID=UPI00255CB0A2|nr:transposase [Devosia sp. YIM 151766]WIY53908.1 transposase [Devosia sp. YIM 151766]
MDADEFIRRFLIHTLPCGFHRIRHYGLLAGSARKDLPSPCFDGTVVIIEIFAAWCQLRAPPPKRPPTRKTVHERHDLLVQTAYRRWRGEPGTPAGRAAPRADAAERRP